MILDKNAKDNVIINLAFQGHYNENDLEISVSRKMLKENGNSVRIIMSGDTFAVKSGKNYTNWESVQALVDSMHLNEVIGNVAFKQSPAKAKVAIPKPKALPKKTSPKAETKTEQISSKSSNAPSQSTNPYSNYTDEDAMPPVIDQAYID